MASPSVDPVPRWRRVSGRWLVATLTALVAGTIVAPRTNANPFEPERAILSVEINGESVGDMFVCLAQETGDVYLEQSDYTRLGLGFGESQGLVRINNTPFISLASLQPRLKFEIDPAELSLSIMARPEIPGVRKISGVDGSSGAAFLDGSSVFFNYDLESNRPPDASSTDTVLTHELGFRKGRVLALSSAAWWRSAGLSDYQRLQSQVIVDYRHSMRRLTMLDTVATSGPLGSTMPILGATLSKDFSIDPYFIRHPMPGLAGSVMTASDVEVYQNGFLRHDFHIPPGQFYIEDLPVSAIGLGSYDVVIRDAFGHETSLSESFYLSRSLLRKGLHAYNYGLGLQRENAFTGEPEYGDPAMTGQHRYGFNHWATFGANIEASPDVHAAGLTADLQIARAGVISFGASFGGGVGSGGAGYLAYSYNAPRYAANIFVRGFSEGYTNLQRERLSDPARFEALTRFSVRVARFTSLSLISRRTETVNRVATSRIGVTVNQRLNPKLNLVATYEHQTMTVPGALSTDDDILFAGLHVFLPSRTTVDVTHSSDSSSSRQATTVRRNVPLQEGHGYRVTLERLGSDGIDDEIKPSGYFVFNGPRGSYRAEYDQVDGRPTWRVGTAGSLSLIDGSFFASRPLQQSFAVVRTANLKGVRVSYNGEPAGRTRRNGEILIPNLRSYEVNKLSISEEDLPMDYSVETLQREVIPAPRSGVVVDFEVQRLSAIFGRLVVQVDEKRSSLEHLNLSIEGIAKDISWRSGLDGEFYLENIPEGIHELQGVIGERTYRCLIEIPSASESMIDLGEVLCELVP